MSFRLFPPSTVDGALGALGAALADLKKVLEDHTMAFQTHQSMADHFKREIERGGRVRSKLEELLS